MPAENTLSKSWIIIPKSHAVVHATRNHRGCVLGNIQGSDAHWVANEGLSDLVAIVINFDLGDLLVLSSDKDGVLLPGDASEGLADIHYVWNFSVRFWSNLMWAALSVGAIESSLWELAIFVGLDQKWQGFVKESSFLRLNWENTDLSSDGRCNNLLIIWHKIAAH